MIIRRRVQKEVSAESNTLAVLLSTNTATDTAAQYITHLDIRPDQWPHLARGWTLEAVAMVEAGTRGASDAERVTAGAVAKSLSFRIGAPAGNVPGTLTGLQSMAGPSMTAAQINGVMNLQGVCRAGLNGVGLEVINAGIGYPGFVTAAVTSNGTDWKASGIRVCLAGNWASAAAGNIIKVLAFSVRLRAQL